MAEVSVAITPGSGKNIAVEEEVISGTTIERQSIALNNLCESLKQFIRAIQAPPGVDGLGRQSVFCNGGNVAISALPTLPTLTTLTSITNPAYTVQPGAFQSFPSFQPVSQIAWAETTRSRIS